MPLATWCLLSATIRHRKSTPITGANPCMFLLSWKHLESRIWLNRASTAKRSHHRIAIQLREGKQLKLHWTSLSFADSKVSCIVISLLIIIHRSTSKWRRKRWVYHSYAFLAVYLLTFCFRSLDDAITARRTGRRRSAGKEEERGIGRVDRGSYSCIFV